MKKTMFFLTALMSFNVLAERIERPIANPGQTTWRDDITDILLLEQLGYDKASDEVFDLVDRIKQEMNMGDWSVDCRKISQQAEDWYYRNHISYGIPISSKFIDGERLIFMNGGFIYIDPILRVCRFYVHETLFNQMSQEEKTFLIRQNLTRLKNGHNYQKLGVIALAAVGLAVGFNYVRPYQRSEFTFWYSLAALAGGAYYLRSLERDADKGGVCDASSARGGAMLYERLAKERDPLSRFVLVRALRSLVQFCVGWTAFYPSYEERQSFCEAQYEQLSTQETQAA